MRTLLIDNYDSYTYNLFQVIAEVNGELPLVYYNDEITLEQIQSMVQAGTVQNIVISPGPGTPSNPHDIGVCLDALQQLPDVPILGICLGHQALALAHGGAVVSAPEPVHGRLSRLRHNGHGLFHDIPSGPGFEVVRYHSLLVDQASLPACLEPVCWTAGAHAAVKLARDAAAAAAPGLGAAAPTGAGADGPADAHAETDQRRPREAGRDEQQAASPLDPQQSAAVGHQHQQQPDALLMGLVHRSRPHYGVQFHPESVATRYGIALLRNFRDLSAKHIRTRGGAAAAAQLPAVPRAVEDIVGPPGRLTELAPWPSPEHQRGAGVRLAWERLGGLLGRLPEGGSQAVFEHLFGWAQDTFWLDSAAADRGRFSYMGGRGGPLWRKFTYKLPEPQAQQQHQQHQCSSTQEQPSQQQQPEAEHPQERISPAADTTTAAPERSPCSMQAAACLTEDSAPQQPPQQQQPACDPDSDAASSSSSSSGAACCAGSAGDPGSTAGASSILTASAGPSDLAPPHAPAAGAYAGTLLTEDATGHVTRQLARGGFLAFLQALLARQRLLVEPEAAAALPFNFWGGLVGYLGYELKAECGAANAHAASTPDAVMYLADRLVAVDHRQGDVFLLALYGEGGSGEDGSGGGGGDGSGDGVGSRGGCGDSSAQGEEEGEAGTDGQVGSAAGGKEQACAWLRETRSVLEGLAAASEAAAAAVAAATEETGGACRARACCGQKETRAPVAARCGPADQSGTSVSARSEAASALGCCHSTSPTSSPGLPTGGSQAQAEEQPAQQPVVPFRLEHCRTAYLRNIAACHAALHAGESYEVCLTTALSRPAAPDPAALYRLLRQLNPAPYAAWLQCGAGGPTICCSSPERFLRGDRGGLLEARPIKGTAARVLADPAADAAAAAELASSEKERAENLMIVDLLRNDLGRVCEVGSVHVPGLMDIESYATVHQMVSTVRGVRRAGLSAVDCIRAAFPGGSMTGAPKVRTMAIIDGLEGRARGVYSGCIGFISLNDTFDLNIVIRTAVIEEEKGNPAQSTPGDATSTPAGAPAARSMSIGAGGAIVVQSEPEAEYEEMRLKARALLRAVGLCEGSEGPVPVDAD